MIGLSFGGRRWQEALANANVRSDMGSEIVFREHISQDDQLQEVQIVDVLKFVLFANVKLFCIVKASSSIGQLPQNTALKLS